MLWEYKTQNDGFNCWLPNVMLQSQFFIIHIGKRQKKKSPTDVQNDF